MFVESFNNILRPWVSIIANSNQCFPEEICKNAAMQIFNTYLKCHLSPPNGTKTTSEDDEVYENEEDDRVENKEQLQYIGIFGRLVSIYIYELIYVSVNMTKSFDTYNTSFFS